LSLKERGCHKSSRTKEAEEETQGVEYGQVARKKKKKVRAEKEWRGEKKGAIYSSPPTTTNLTSCCKIQRVQRGILLRPSTKKGKRAKITREKKGKMAFVYQRDIPKTNFNSLLKVGSSSKLSSGGGERRGAQKTVVSFKARMYPSDGTEVKGEDARENFLCRMSGKESRGGPDRGRGGGE